MVGITELEEQCSVLKNLANSSDCPCDEQLRKRLSGVRMSLDRFFCRKWCRRPGRHEQSAVADLFQYILTSYTFIAPVVVGGLLAITVLIAVGLLIYYRNSRRVRQVRECFEMNPVHFVRTALQYVMMHNHADEQQTRFLKTSWYSFTMMTGAAFIVILYKRCKESGH